MASEFRALFKKKYIIGKQISGGYREPIWEANICFGMNVDKIDSVKFSEEGIERRNEPLTLAVK